LTTAPDLAPTILELAGIEAPATMRGDSFAEVLRGEKDEHRHFVVSSWPLYFARGAITTAVDSVPRHIASHMPITVTTRERSLIFGGPEDPPELYDLESDPDEQTNLWESRPDEGAALMERAVSFLERQGTPEHHLTLRRKAAKEFAWRPPPSTGGERDGWGSDESKEAG
jgi:arylsulfatase A-like enzyme